MRRSSSPRRPTISIPTSLPHSRWQQIAWSKGGGLAGAVVVLKIEQRLADWRDGPLNLIRMIRRCLHAGHALGLFVGEVEEGAALLARAISLDPNLALARIWNGYAQLYLGDGDAAIEQFQIGLRLSPLDPRIFLAQTGMAAAHFLAGRYEDGFLWAKIAVQQNPDFVGAHRILMACHAMAGRVEEARQAWAVARQIDPTQRISIVSKRLQHFRRPQDVQRYAEAFRIVGMPE